METEINQVRSLFSVAIHALIFNEKQFVEMLHSKESNVCKEAEKHRIILNGIEDYYGLAYD